MHKFFFWRNTCKDIHRLVAEQYDRSLTTCERIQTKLHLRACEPCTHFSAHLSLLNQAMRKLSQSVDPLGPEENVLNTGPINSELDLNNQLLLGTKTAQPDKTAPVNKDKPSQTE